MLHEQVANLNGGRGEVVNTTGCDPVIRGFDPRRSPI